MMNYCTKYHISVVPVPCMHTMHSIYVRCTNCVCIGCAQVGDRTTDDNLFAFNNVRCVWLEKGGEWANKFSMRRSLLQCVINMHHLIGHH